ncbi:MAG: hypothetical protein EOM37_03985 [Proteobacteria bacterium]|nr:hypothetical protein [Alphaproteobacteria bacterium]NCC03195.1 hypothetical protein [Pseudomonadota bacterium]
MPKLSRNQIVQAAAMLDNRSNYAYAINQILTLFYEKHLARIKDWSSGQEHRTKFLSDYQRLLLRGLLAELAIVFDKHSVRNHKYSIEPILEHIESYLRTGSPEGRIFILSEELFKVNFQGFLTIKKDVLDETRISDDAYILSVMKYELGQFKKQHKEGFDALLSIRDKYIAHPDIDHQKEKMYAYFLSKVSEWAFCYTNLLLQMMVASGAPNYVNDSRSQILAFTEEPYNKLISELIT